MIERFFVKQRLKEYQIEEFISDNLKNVGHSHTKVQRTPLGEKVVVHSSRPGLVVGKKGQNISSLTRMLKKKFDMENPQIEISEVENPELDAKIVAERIAVSLERFGSKRFKGIMHKAMEDALNRGARGIEIVVSGKVPSQRARSWRVYGGHLKKCGDIASTKVRKSKSVALLKSGIIGIKVSILTSDVKLPDDVEIVEHQEQNAGQVEK